MLNISRQRLGPFMCVAGASGYHHVAQVKSVKIGLLRLKSVRIGLAYQSWISLGMANLPIESGN